MSVKEFRNIAQAQPFRPFAIHLADGRAIQVHHQDFVFVAPVGQEVIVYQPDGTMNIIDLFLVTDIEIKPSKGKTSASN